MSSESALWGKYHEAERLFKEGNFGRAEGLFRETAEGRQRLLGREHPNTLWSKYHLGRTLQYLSRHNEAEKFLQEAVEGRRHRLGRRHRDTLWSMYWLAEAFYKQGKYAEAEDLYRQTAQGRQDTLGANHPHTLWSKHYQARALQHMKRDAEAERLFRETAQGREKALGPGHSETLWSKYQLAQTLYSQGKYGEAEDVFRQTAQGRQTTLGLQNPDTLWSKYWLGRTLKYLEKYDEAAETLGETLEGREATLGSGHLDTVWSKYWLAETMYNQKKYGDAATLFRETLREREERLGRENSDTLLSKNWVDCLALLATLLERRSDSQTRTQPGRPSLESAAGRADTDVDITQTAATERSESGSGTLASEVVFDSAEFATSGVSEIVSRKQLEADKWLELMQGVERFFNLHRRRPVKRKEMVDILLIDSGIDLTHPVFKRIDPKGRQVSESFCWDFINDRPCVIDSTGHGTHCAHTILKICSTARLYVARVFEGNSGDQHTVERIVKAIDWGVERDVDIVCMAFAFSQPDYTLSNAIRQARGRPGSRDMLFFAAASNNKYYSEDPVGFPANLDDVIRVNSCAYTGAKSHFSPDGSERRGGNLGVIGEEMPAALAGGPGNNNNDAGEREQRMSGTSVATAVLTGIAALVVEFSRLRAAPRIDTSRTCEQVTAELLRNAGMKRVLYHCLVGTNPPVPPGYSFIKPWVLFDLHNQEIVALRIREAMRRSPV